MQESLDIEKGRKAYPVGTRRKFGDVIYVKTPKHWRPEKYVGHLYPDPHKTVTHDPIPEPVREKEEAPKETTDFPKLSELSYSASLGGSSDVELMTAPNGSKYAVKRARYKGDYYANNQLKQEKLADDIYKLMDFNSPNSVLEMDTDGVMHKIAKFIPDVKQLNTYTGGIAKQRLRKEIQKGFVLDCLLGNWDVIGQGKDNILVTDNGQVIRVDNGGALEFKARGDRKEGSQFGPEITELTSFLDSSTNPVTAEIYGGITEEEIRKQALDILDNKVNILALVAKFEHKYPESGGITKKLAARLVWLEENVVNKKAPVEEEDYDKSKYSSKVTQDYFADWDSLELEGNPQIKDSIKKHILEIEKKYEEVYKKYATNHGISVGEYKQRLQNRIEKLMNESEYFRMTDIGILDKILVEHGRFKTLFETGTSHGSTSTYSRGNAEYEYFGFPKSEDDYDKTKRPVYGYCSNNTNGVNNLSLTTPPPNNASQYGQVTIKIQKDVALKKATVTFRDSLGYEGNIAATPAAKPHFTSFAINSGDPLSKNDWDGEITSTGERDYYTEIQYHNQLTFDDIQSVHMSINEPRGYNDTDRIQMHLDKINRMIEIGRKTNVPIKLYGNS